MIQIEKDKILYIDDSNEIHEIYSAELPAYLSDVVDLGEFVTFARIFDLIVDNAALFNTIFAKALEHHTIDQFLQEYNKPASHSNDRYDLEVHIVCQAHNFQDYMEFEFYTSFHGVGILEGDKEAEEPYPISLSLVPLNELKNRYIRINNEVQIYTFSEEGTFERSAVYNGEVKLFDFFAAILNEISFYGDPESRDEVSEEINESAEAAESGEEELIRWEEVHERWEKELDEAQQEENKIRLDNVKEQVSSGYIRDFIESTFQETIEKLEMLEKDLVGLERYEDAKLVRTKIENLTSRR